MVRAVPMTQGAAAGRQLVDILTFHGAPYQGLAACVLSAACCLLLAFGFWLAACHASWLN
jgi:hypothetical protein